MLLMLDIFNLKRFILFKLNVLYCDEHDIFVFYILKLVIKITLIVILLLITGSLFKYHIILISSIF